MPDVNDTPETMSVFIGGLAYKTSEEGLRSFLKEKNVEPLSVEIIMKDDQSRGFGYADFDSQEEMDKCMELTGEELDGRTLRCNPRESRGRGGRGGRGGGFRGDRGGRGGDGRGGSGGNFDNETPTKLLMIKNLSFSTDNDSLASYFPDSNDARVVRDRYTGDSRGFGFVEFDDVETATKAREDLSGTEIDGRTVNIVFATPRESFGGGRGGRGGRGGFRGGSN